MAWKQTSRKISGLTGNSELTQEQLAEVLGVSVGAVYKCESRSSLPELRLITSRETRLIRHPWMRFCLTALK